MIHLFGYDNVICLEGFSKERFIKISTHEIKKEGGGGSGGR